jgi:hypothetical protein
MADCSQSDAQSYFLSYSRADEEFALRLAKDLRAQGVAIFVDQWDIRPSEHWDRAIERAVGSSRGLVVIISPRSVASDNVMDEVSFAIDSHKAVLPVMIEKSTLPLRMTRMHLIDATRSYESALQQCLAELVHSPDRETSVEPAKATAPAPLDPDAVSRAKRELTPIVGPIAKYLVERESARATSVKDLYRLLAEHIGDQTDRDRFLASAPHDSAPSSSAEKAAHTQTAAEPAAHPSTELDSIARALTRYLGPIAPMVTKRESRNCSSVAQLHERLAALIHTEQDRKAFLRQVEDHHA